jgi:hypothetical protein
MKHIILFCIFFAVQSGYAQQMHSNKNLNKLITMMTGSFSSGVQAKNDSSYFDIRLHISRIWQDRKDGIYLYVEQAMAARQDKPYRQRIYKVMALSDSTFESAVYTMKDPLRFTGAWQNPAILGALSPDSLEARTGCSVFLTLNGESFSGSTKGNECPSDLRGAAWASSEVTLNMRGMNSWDRGFDKQGKQVWGAVKGGYQFLKEKE